MSASDQRWTTSDEIAFLYGLGSHAWTSTHDKRPPTESERLFLLRGYQRSMLRRKDWGFINPRAVKANVEEMIYNLESQKVAV